MNYAIISAAISLLTAFIITVFIYIYKKVSTEYEKKIFELSAKITELSKKDDKYQLQKIRISLDDIETIKSFLINSEYDEVEWNDPNIIGPAASNTIIIHK